MTAVIHKGAPIFFSGLLILFAAVYCPAQTFDVGGGGGMLLYLDDGSVTHGSMAISYQDSSNFQFKWNIWDITSDLHEFSTGVSGMGYMFGLPLYGVRPKIAVGLAKMSDITIRQAISRTEIEGANILYTGASVDFDALGARIAPSVFFANARFGNGSWYYFYGKPDIPAFWRIGLTAEYGEGHRSGLTYYKLDFEIVNDSGFTLVRSDKNYSAGVSYGYAFPFLPQTFSLNATAGVNYAYIDIDGSLTRENQQYWGFPYAFFNVTGMCDAFFGWTAATFIYRRKSLNHKLTGAALQFFGGELYIGTHIKYRPRIFHNQGDREYEDDAAAADMSITRGGIVAYSLEGHKKFVDDKLALDFEIQKILGYSWRMAEVMIFEEPETGAASSRTRDWKSALRTALLSGLSVRVGAAF